jgi:hypothetical protein
VPAEDHWLLVLAMADVLAIGEVVAIADTALPAMGSKCVTITFPTSAFIVSATTLVEGICESW